MIRTTFLGVALLAASQLTAGPTPDLYEIRVTGLVEVAFVNGAPTPIFNDPAIGQTWTASYLYDASIPLNDDVIPRAFSIRSFSIGLESELVVVDDVPVGNAYMRPSGFGPTSYVSAIAAELQPDRAIVTELLLRGDNVDLARMFRESRTIDPELVASGEIVVITNYARSFSGSFTSLTITRVPSPGLPAIALTVGLAITRRRR